MTEGRLLRLTAPHVVAVAVVVVEVVVVEQAWQRPKALHSRRTRCRMTARNLMRMRMKRRMSGVAVACRASCSCALFSPSCSPSCCSSCLSCGGRDPFAHSPPVHAPGGSSARVRLTAIENVTVVEIDGGDDETRVTTTNEVWRTKKKKRTRTRTKRTETTRKTMIRCGAAPGIVNATTVLVDEHETANHPSDDVRRDPALLRPLPGLGTNAHPARREGATMSDSVAGEAANHWRRQRCFQVAWF
jgi:hypothetical protein